MTESPLRVLIIGAGIGGLALGQALRAGGIDVTIFERDRAPADWLQGYRIAINPNGSRALHACLPARNWEAFLATSVVSPAGITFRTEQLHELMSLGPDEVTRGSSDPARGAYAVSRIVLRRVLLAGLDDVVRFGARFERYTSTTDGVIAHFADGSTARGDLLVGADGANSRVCAQYLPGARRVYMSAGGLSGRLPLTAATRCWLPDYLAQGMCLVQPLTGRSMFLSAFPGRRNLVNALPDPRRAHVLIDIGLDPARVVDDLDDYVLWALLIPQRQIPLAATAPTGRDHALDLARGWDPALQRVIAETDPNTVGAMRFRHSAIVEPWPPTSVTVLGDAVHNMPPVGGLGANAAVTDAAELADRLLAVRGRDGLTDAVARYEQRMREHGYAAMRAAIRNAERAVSTNVAARRAGRAWFRLCRAVPALKRRTFASAGQPQ